MAEFAPTYTSTLPQDFGTGGKLKITSSKNTANKNTIKKQGNERQEKMKRLRERMKDSQAENRQAVLDEHAKIQSQLKPWEESSLLRKKQTAEKLVEKKRIEDAGLDYERLRNLQYTVEEVEAWSRRMVEKKEGACIDFSDYATAHLRKYNRLLKGIKVDDQHSEEPIAPISTDLIIDKAEPEKVAEMVKDLEEQHDPDADVSYINEKNKKFNEKLGRSYDKYTEEIRESFERGTAL